MRYQFLIVTCSFTFALVAGSGLCRQGEAIEHKTRAEISNFEETSSYRDVMEFVERMADASELVHLTSFGHTYEGRDMPLVLIGAPEATPEPVRATGKTRIYLQGNIHAGEVCGKEALQMLVRDFVAGEHRAWLDSLVLLIAPIYNADGNERIDLKNRPRQHGPLKGMGQRANAQGLDLNRDHMKLDSPEARALVRLFTQYDPHVIIDLHTTNGSYHAYHLTYAPPLHPNTPQAIDDLLRQQWLPFVTRRVKQAHGWNFYYYGNLPWRGMNAERGWYTFDHRPRFNNNYAGLRNRLGILSETYAYATFEERIQATRYFVDEVLEFAFGHASMIRSICEAADRVALAGQRLALRARLQRSDEPVEILLGEVREEKNPYSGEVILRRKSTVKPETMYEYGRFVSTEDETVPQMYLIPAQMQALIELVQAHGIQTRRLAETRDIEGEEFRIDSVRTAGRPYQGHVETTLFGQYRQARRSVAAGTVVVSTAQPLGRLAFYLLEPRSDDGVANWGLIAGLPALSVYPIFRVPAH